MSNYPEIRFKGFTDAWEQCKLRENAEILTGGTPNTSITEYWDPKEIPWMSSGEINKKILFETDNKISDKGFNNSSTRWIKENSVLIALAGQGKTRGMVAVNKIPLCTNQSIAAIIPNNNLFYNFIYQNLLTRYEELRLISSGDGTRGGLNKKIISEISLVYPSKSEQKEIGEFFEKIDKTITLHQRKLDKLIETKQAFLQKMFPNNGESIPEVRFKDFSDAWEQREFFENIEKTIDFRGRTPLKIGMKWSHSGYLALSALNVKNGYIENIVDANYGDQELYDKWMKGNELVKGQVLFTTEAPMGNVAQVPDNKGYILSQRTISFVVKKDKITNDFLAVLLKSPNVMNSLSSLASGGTAKGVSQKSLRSLQVLLPLNINEQNMIANIFNNIDRTITLHQRELEKLKEVKQGFLQKLFL